MLIARLIAGRVVMALFTLFLVSLLIFSVLEILSGDVATRILGRDATPESIATLRAQMQLDAPALVRYGNWLAGALRGDFGTSLVSGRAVGDILGQRVVNTAYLSVYAFLLYLPLAILPAILQAVRRDGALDHALSVVTLVLLSIPDFLLGTLLLLLFVLAIPVLPAMSTVDDSSGAWEYLRAMTLPALTLAIVMSVYAVRMLRDNLIEVLDADYIRMAELRGAPAGRVVWRHALPNALVPTLKVTALNLAYLVGGVVVVEKVFGYPGFGSLLVDALQLRDFPVIEATVLLAAAVYIAANFLADVGATVFNPKLRTG